MMRADTSKAWDLKAWHSKAWHGIPGTGSTSSVIVSGCVSLSHSNKGAGLQQVQETSSRGMPCSYGPTALVLRDEWVSCAADQGTASPVKCVHLLPPSIHSMTHMAA